MAGSQGSLNLCSFSYVHTVRLGTIEAPAVWYASTPHSVKSAQGESAGLLRTKGVHGLIVALCWETWKGSHERFRQLRLFSR
jgi:hypothetical protein